MSSSAVCAIVMGVSGSGKSTIAALLSQLLDADLLDADDYHPPSNIEKMSRGEPLQDEDRWEWLAQLNVALRANVAKGRQSVLACSALKQAYRDRIQDGLPCCRWIYLNGSKELIAERMGRRKGHFMPEHLLDSQFAALEPPTDALEIDVSNSLDAIRLQLRDAFSLL